MTVSALPSPPPAAPQRTRWQPTRAGIVNVWRYYDETFAFAGGRLLLRGPNGTGKSKALELLLPYLLDASLRPSRLSTFGGQERTMHWNLMGDGHEGKTRVGYVWVEFARSDPDAPDGISHLTIGARLQATSANRTVRTTYFTTAQRVGVPGGLSLVGDGGRPLTAADLASAIGPHGQVHGGAGEHRRAVRETLYRGFDADKYDALLVALLQLRTPKLSEHLDPAELSDLLSRSLPPLDPQAVAEIAEGFEKLDRRREDLAALERDGVAAARLADRQRRYAQRVVRAAAEDLKRATREMDDLTRTARESAQQHAAATEEQASVDTAIGALDEERLLKGERVEALRRSEAYAAHVQLADLREQLHNLQRAARTAEAAHERAEHALAEDLAAVDRAAEALAQAETHVQLAAGDAERAASRTGLAGVFEQAAEGPLERGRGLLDAAAGARESEIAEVRTALDGHERAVAERDRAAVRRERLRTAHDEAVAARTEAAQAHERALEELASALRTWAAGCRELAVAPDALVAAAADESAVLALVAEAATTAERALATAAAGLAGRTERLQAERDDVAAERDALAGRRDVAPDPPATRTAARKGRSGAPLWQLIDFVSDVDPAVQAAVEAALTDSGLLDAWVSPDGTVEADGHDRFAIPADPTERNLGEILRPEPGGPESAAPVPAAHVTGLLAAIAYGPAAPSHPAAVGADGSWRLGTLHGSWSKAQVEHIGAGARERARQRRLAELDARIAELDGDLAVLAAEQQLLAERRGTLGEEQRTRPGHATLREAVEALARAQLRVESAEREVTEAESEHATAERVVGDALRELAALASEHRLPTDRAALQEVADALRAFRRAGDTWVRARGTRADAEQRRRDTEGLAVRSERAVAEAEREATHAREVARALSIRVQTIEAEAGGDVPRILAEVDALEQRLRAIEDERGAHQRRSRELEGRIGRLGERCEVDEAARTAAVARRDEHGAALRHLGVVGLDVDAGLEVDLAALEGVKPTLEAARALTERLDVPWDAKAIRVAEARMVEVVHEVRTALAGRADIAVETDDRGWSLLVAAVDGLRLGASGLHERLRADLDAGRAELSAEEEELFDATLAGAARRQVADRIRAAGTLVDDMNALLQRVETASRMRVRLRWDIDPELPAALRDARGLILRDPDSLSDADRAALRAFFRARVEEVREADVAVGWAEQLLDVLDYRAWHTFTVQIDRGEGGWQQVTKRTHGQLSGGERAIALHLPLFAAIAAHYAAAPEAPRLILLDEVFVGVDTTNRGQLLDLMVRLDLDAVMTSDHEWCTYTQLDAIAIHQLITGDGDDAVTTARFTWDGERLEQRDPEELALPLVDA